MIRRPPRSTQSRSSAASDVYKRQVPSCTTSLTMCPIRPMWVVLCGPHTATVNDSSVCEGRHGSIHPSEPTNLPTWSQANLVKEPPGELHNRQTYCSHLLLFVVCCRFGTEVRHKNDEGRQQATSRAGVSRQLFLQYTHIRFVFSQDSKEEDPSQEHPRATSRPGAR